MFETRAIVGRIEPEDRSRLLRFEPKSSGENVHLRRESQETAGPVFGMINQSLDNGSKGKMYPIPGLFYAALRVSRVL